MQRRRDLAVRHLCHLCFVRLGRLTPLLLKGAAIRVVLALLPKPCRWSGLAYLCGLACIAAAPAPRIERHASGSRLACCAAHPSSRSNNRCRPSSHPRLPATPRAWLPQERASHRWVLLCRPASALLPARRRCQPPAERARRVATPWSLEIASPTRCLFSRQAHAPGQFQQRLMQQLMQLPPRGPR